MDRLIGEWLEMKAGRSQSRYTRRNYGLAMRRWRMYLAGHEPAVGLWEVDASHVRGWQQELRESGLGEATVNLHLAAVSSFYAWLTRETRVVDGVEVHTWVDAAGKARGNPFRAGNAPRGRTRTYERARVLSRDEVERVLRHMEEQRGIEGARNLALVLTYLYTGWRSAELLRMRWGDLRPSRTETGVWIYAWRGKGGKAQDDVLPAPCVAAIDRYLRQAGRLGPGVLPADEEFIWLPVRQTNTEQLHNGRPFEAGRAISEKTALRVLRGALHGAGIRRAQEYRIHDLRHTHAHLLIEAGLSVAAVQQRLHHSSLATTGLYLRAVHGQEPVDVVSGAFAALLRKQSAPD